mmetsp:Transcript_1487/g.2176  ORF Transcript_1487/g.2176 Transcript_1487/m.2176 type:complete len:482 (-) Transcript_1487:451-1896(-)
MVPSTYVILQEECKKIVKEEESQEERNRSNSRTSITGSRRLSLSAGALDTAELIAEVEKAGGKGSLRLCIEPRGAANKAKKIKNLNEIAAFDEQIRIVADDEGLKALTSLPALQKERVARALKSIDAKQLEQWLQALVDTPSLRALAIAFCKGGRVSGDVELLENAEEQDEEEEDNETTPPHKMVRARALWDFTPSSESELGLVEGDFLEIAVPESADISDLESVLATEATDGWLLGRSERTKEVGYFPAAYVEPVTTKEIQPIVKEPIPTSTISDASRASRPVSMRTLAAFDALSSAGVAVEKSAGNGGRRIQDGDVITARCTASAWDGGAGLSTPFASTEWGGPDLVLKVGALDAATEGLHFALRGLCQGDSARVTCAPTMAYGDAGLPGAVPQGSFLIYDISILDVSDTSTYQKPSGPQAILARSAKTLDESGPKLGRVVSQRKRLTVGNDSQGGSNNNRAGSTTFRQLSTHQEEEET